tara:strand:- start:152 stop:487 length:336 start_codon:yes stop_codon:yes gene_type:complete
MKFKVKGKVKIVTDEIQVGKQNYPKRTIVIDATPAEEESLICIDFVGGAGVAKIQGKRPGDIVEIEFTIKGREWNGKYYNNVSGWGCELITPIEQIKEPVKSPVNENDLPF